ncbi:MAG: DUF4112 domain-containing protein [Acidobacteriota bacterium]|nr:DUF4112 domain-containing protein [Acidobacteriota bacterium]
MQPASDKLQKGNVAYPELAPHSTGTPRLTRPTQVQIERELEVLAQVMDNQFAIPVLGWRFGVNAIIDLVPGIGDVATSLIAVYVLISAVRYRVPKITLLRMALNIAIYFLGGVVPWVGDIFEAWWKPNMRNLALLRKRATVSAEDAHKARSSDWLFVGIIILGLLAMLLGSLALSALIIWYIFHPAS